jgi:hypothetical protein
MVMSEISHKAPDNWLAMPVTEVATQYIQINPQTGKQRTNGVTHQRHVRTPAFRTVDGRGFQIGFVPFLADSAHVRQRLTLLELKAVLCLKLGKCRKVTFDHFVVELDLLVLILHASFRVAGKDTETVCHKHTEVTDHDRPGVAGFREQSTNFLLGRRAAPLTCFVHGERGIGQEEDVVWQHLVEHMAHGGKQHFCVCPDFHQAITLPAQFLYVR